MSKNEVLETVLKIAERYCGRTTIESDHIVGDLNITRGDAVEFYTELERTFDIDLRPITETIEVTGKSRFWQTHVRPTPRDPIINEIVNYISKSRCTK